MGWRDGFLVVVGLVSVAGGQPAEACSSYRTDSLFVGTSIGLLVDTEDAKGAGILALAVGMWEQCHNYGSGFPSFVVGEPGTRTLRVEFLLEVAGEEKCGSFGQETIRIYGYQRVGGEMFSCGDLAQNLAHELGHALGLGDGSSAQRCQLHVMSWITADNAYRRAVQPAECQAAGQRWLTAEELTSVQRSADLRVASLTTGRLD
ncbi:MAG: hypothetical protein K8J08_06635, partial [Thermoanaerobaculia bacterium]|nr:hypothetical protein [Thermoanaerobaculia bacterium]